MAPGGSEVLVDGAPAAIAEDGRFRVRVARRARQDQRPGLHPRRQRPRDHPDRGLRQQRQRPHIKDFAIRWRKKAP